MIGCRSSRAAVDRIEVVRREDRDLQRMAVLDREADHAARQDAIGDELVGS